MTVEVIVEERIACPRCASVALYRFGRVRSGLQRYLCLMCGRQFIPGHERIISLLRPSCRYVRRRDASFQKDDWP